MEAATDQTHPAEPAQASSPTTHGGRGPQPYRQDPGSILLAATPIGDVRDASPRVIAALEEQMSSLLRTHAVRSHWPRAWASSWAVA